MKATIRQGTRDDIPRLMEIASESPTASQWTPADYEQLFAPKIVQQTCLLLADVAGHVKGFIVARGLDGDWEIENIVVARDFRRQGLGAELLKTYLQKIAAGNAGKGAAKTVHLEVRASNEPALQLYKTLGFAHIGRRKAYYSLPSEDAIILKYSF